MDPFLGEIRCFSFGRIPVGWLPCNGQLLQINQNQALYSLLGNKYGGDGITTFGLPNLQGTVPIDRNNTYDAPNPKTPIGATGGAETVTLTAAMLPAHTHLISVSNEDATAVLPKGDYLAATGTPDLGYSPSSPSPQPTLAPNVVSTVGGGQAHSNLQPFLVVNYCIATQGTYPPQP